MRSGWRIAVVVATVEAAAGCNQIAGIREGVPLEQTCVPGEIVPCYSGPATTVGVGACVTGQRTCNEDGLGFGPCVGEVLPAAETCEAAGVDEDCDGLVNEDGSGCVCGDGYVSAGEECDDGNLDSTDVCTAMCQPATCGDGFLQEGTGETCDDGTMTDGDICSPACQKQEVLGIVCGHAHTCALLSQGLIKCWGRNSEGQLGLGDTNQRGDDPEEMADDLRAVDLGSGNAALALAAASHHTCVILDGGSVKCWGDNAFGQLGLGDTITRGNDPGGMGDGLPAVNLGNGKTAVALAAGGSHMCAILDDNSVKCWGWNNSGQLGLGHLLQIGDASGEMGENLPTVSLGSGKTALALAAGGAHTCALLNDGSVKCWGSNAFGQLGRENNVSRGGAMNEMGDYLDTVNLGSGVIALAVVAGGYHTCALLAGGTVKCWGYNSSGQLGAGHINPLGDELGEMGNNLPVVDLGAGRTAVSLAAGYYHTCALLDDGSVKCWGTSIRGQLGLGSVDSRGDAPEEMGNNLPVVELGNGAMALSLTGGYYHTCARLDNGSVKCWGWNEHGQLGLGDTDDRGVGPGEMGDALESVKLFSPFW